MVDPRVESSGSRKRKELDNDAPMIDSTKKQGESSRTPFTDITNLMGATDFIQVGMRLGKTNANVVPAREAHSVERSVQMEPIVQEIHDYFPFLPLPNKAVDDYSAAAELEVLKEWIASSGKLLLQSAMGVDKLMHTIEDGAFEAIVEKDEELQELKKLGRKELRKRDMIIQALRLQVTDLQITNARQNCSLSNAYAKIEYLNGLILNQFYKPDSDASKNRDWKALTP